MPKKTLLWNDISDFARDKFNVYAGEGQHIWAEQAWDAIVQAGLADYEDEIQRHLVLIRLITLATMYREFCDLVFEDYFCREEIVYNGWIEEESIFHQIRIWQIIGSDFYKDEKIIDDEYDDLLTEALNELIDRYRYQVYEALNRKFNYDLTLFVSMLITRYSRDDGTYYDIKNLSEDEWEQFSELKDEDEEKGFYWVSIGMPSYPRENV